MRECPWNLAQTLARVEQASEVLQHLAGPNQPEPV